MFFLFLSLEAKTLAPKDINGTFVKLVPEIKGKDQNLHPFDKLGVVYAFKFSKGEVQYERFPVPSSAYEQYKKSGKAEHDGFYQKTGNTHLFNQMLNAHSFKAKVQDIKKDVFVTTETPPQIFLTGKALEWKDELPKSRIYENAFIKDSYSYMMHFGLFSTDYVVYKIQDCCRIPICRITTHTPAYMHSFAVTENYFILLEIPFRLSRPFPNLFSAFMKSFEFYPEEKTRVLCIDKKTGEVKEFFTKSFFYYHIANAFEDNGSINIDVVGYDKPLVSLEEKNVNNRLMRIVLKQDAEPVVVEHERACEFPVINPEIAGKNYRFIYALRTDLSKKFEQMGVGLLKIDLNGDMKSFSKKDCIFGEPAFIRRHYERSEESCKASTEDDGWLIGIMSNTAERKSYLYVLNAQTMELVYSQPMRDYVASIGFHGRFFSS
ncbi:MAG: carotenoid oxygenase family protein [Alphaproteobacteria bacterium]|nr:MAG: carotenoid oxygenase family protein [Alphaproteobacteria bacterium]